MVRHVVPLAGRMKAVYGGLPPGFAESRSKAAQAVAISPLADAVAAAVAERAACREGGAATGAMQRLIDLLAGRDGRVGGDTAQALRTGAGLYHRYCGFSYSVTDEGVGLLYTVLAVRLFSRAFLVANSPHFVSMVAGALRVALARLPSCSGSGDLPFHFNTWRKVWEAANVVRPFFPILNNDPGGPADNFASCSACTSASARGTQARRGRRRWRPWWRPRPRRKASCGPCT